MPGVTALMAWLLLGENLSWLAACGLVVASIGCWLVGATRPAITPSPVVGAAPVAAGLARSGGFDKVSQ
jgi:drug/metabolite transporter (DMT)-like permease